MSNYSRFEAGPPLAWADLSFTHAAFPKPVRGKRFLSQDLDLKGMEVSLNVFPPGRKMPFLHRHRQNEELYLFLSGQGEFRVDEDRFPVGAGTAVRVSPAALRTWRNVGEEPLVFIVIQARAEPPIDNMIEDGEPLPDEAGW